MINITLPSIRNLPLQNPSTINLTPILSSKNASKFFYCNDCSKRFVRKNSLIRHLRVYANYMPYNCKVCIKNFSRKDILSKHKESVKCIRKIQAYIIMQTESASDIEYGPSKTPSTTLTQSRMSTSSLVSTFLT